jgi:hypothetical protein
LITPPADRQLHRAHLLRAPATRRPRTAEIGWRARRRRSIAALGHRHALRPGVADQGRGDDDAVLLLVQDGVIALDDPVRRHLPEFEGRWKDA